MTFAGAFPGTITRRRSGPGRRDDAGEWIPGGIEETELAASVQPVATEDVDAASGDRLLERLVVYVPGAGELAAAFDAAEADRVAVDGLEYVVEVSRSWPGSHTRAVLLREV